METKTRNKVYPLAMTAVMAAVICVLGPPFHSRGAGAHLLYEFCHLHHAVCSGLETGYRQLFGLCAHRHDGNACVLRVLRRPGQAGGPTGGYIVGFIPMAVIAGLVIDKFRNRGVQLAGMIGAHRPVLCLWHGLVLLPGGKRSAARPDHVRIPLYSRGPGQDGSGYCGRTDAPEPAEKSWAPAGGIK